MRRSFRKRINNHPMGVLQRRNGAKVDGSSFGKFPLKNMGDIGQQQHFFWSPKLLLPLLQLILHF
jgi:hypothetical protein